MIAPNPEDYTGAMPAGWNGGQHLPKWWRGKIIHLYTLRRPCGQCGSEMRIDVTKAALEGKVKNAGLHLKRCKVCRAKAKALGTVSRPHVDGEELAVVTVDEALRTANATMKEELEGLYAQNAVLRGEADELRQRLSKYELAPAMEAVANGTRMPWDV